MNIVDFIFPLIGGLGFFFFGMQFMSDGLKKIAGEKLKSILHIATKVPIVGIMVGAGITCLIQSSSATTVMAVGFVNAGLLVLRQAICIVMGANIGTTFTAWIVSSMGVFNVTNYALPAIGIGFAIMKLARTRKIKSWGQVLMGFGLLFIGLSFMKDAFVPLKDSDLIKDIFASFGNNPILGVLAGLVFTVLLQSSSATIAIVQVLAFNGVLSFSAAIPIILGDNIGTTITAQMAAIDGNLNAKRTAMSHTLFNVIGTSYMLFFVYFGWYEKAINSIIPGSITTANIMFYIAVSHSFFNVTNTIVFLPFIGWLEKACIWILPKKPGAIETGTQYLERHLLDTPPIAIEQARKEAVYMLSLATKSVSTAVKGYMENNHKFLDPVVKYEHAVDNLQSEITQYLVELSQKNLSVEETEKLPVLIHCVNDIERIGDHSENILELAERKIDQKLPFTAEASKCINSIWTEVEHMLKETEEALNSGDIDIAKKVLAREEKVNTLQEVLKKGHVKRLSKGECNVQAGVVYVDLIDNLEKIGDHLTNIAQAVMSHMRWKESKEAVFQDNI